MSLSAKRIRIAIAGAALWLIWVVWKPVTFNLPENLQQVETARDLSALKPGDTLLVTGQISPYPSSPSRS